MITPEELNRRARAICDLKNMEPYKDFVRCVVATPCFSNPRVASPFLMVLSAPQRYLPTHAPRSEN